MMILMNPLMDQKPLLTSECLPMDCEMTMIDNRLDG